MAVMNFSDHLIKVSKEKDSVLVVGLDPDLSYFPDYLRKTILMIHIKKLKIQYFISISLLLIAFATLL